MHAGISAHHKRSVNKAINISFNSIYCKHSKKMTFGVKTKTHYSVCLSMSRENKRQQEQSSWHRRDGNACPSVCYNHTKEWICSSNLGLPSGALQPRRQLLPETAPQREVKGQLHLQNKQKHAHTLSAGVIYIVEHLRRPALPSSCL